MDPVSAAIVAALVATGVVRRWFADGWDSARGRGRPRHERLMQQRQHEHELRKLALQYRHAERKAGVGGSTIGEAVAERIRRGPTRYEDMHPWRRWWYDQCSDTTERLTRERREREARTEAGEQWWQRGRDRVADWAAERARRAGERWRERHHGQDPDRAGPEWWDSERLDDQPDRTVPPEPAPADQAPVDDRYCLGGCGRFGGHDGWCYRCRADRSAAGRSDHSASPNTPHLHPELEPGWPTSDSEGGAASSRTWDGSPETPADTRFLDLRESGYEGWIDRDGYKAPCPVCGREDCTEGLTAHVARTDVPSPIEAARAAVERVPEPPESPSETSQGVSMGEIVSPETAKASADFFDTEFTSLIGQLDTNIGQLDQEDVEGREFYANIKDGLAGLLAQISSAAETFQRHVEKKDVLHAGGTPGSGRYMGLDDRTA